MHNQTTVILMYVISLFVLGLMTGSFLNVVIYRLPLGLSLIDPPSSCPRCGNQIAHRDNIPLLGWLLLGGKCRHCHNPIPWRYPGVELLNGLLWAAEGWRLAKFSYSPLTGAGIGLLELLFISSLVVVIFIDYDHQIIPDEISLGGLAIALLAAPLLPALHYADSPERYFTHYPELHRLFGPSAPWLKSLAASFVGALAGAIVSLLLYFAGNLLFKKQIERARRDDPEIDSALGLGDVKLLAMLGAFLGWRAVVADFLIACLLGAFIGSAVRFRSGRAEAGSGILSSLKQRWETGAAVVPFGPFLVLAALLILFFRDFIFALPAMLLRH